MGEVSIVLFFSYPLLSPCSRLLNVFLKMTTEFTPSSAPKFLLFVNLAVRASQNTEKLERFPGELHKLFIAFPLLFLPLSSVIYDFLPSRAFLGIMTLILKASPPP